MSDDNGVVIAQDGSVMRITLNRPDRRNALTTSMTRTMTERIVEAGRGDVARVIVIRGEGSHFCVGADLVESNNPSQERPRAGHMERRLVWGPHQLMSTLVRVQIPVVTVVRGMAAGIGLALALSGDYVIADETATFWSPFVGKGFTPDSGNTWLLPKLIGTARAKDMILRSRKVGADEAGQWGMVTAVVPSDELDDYSNAIVNEFASAATVAVGLSKSLMQQNATVSFDEALYNEAITEELAIRTRDFSEGIKAFAERREPHFGGG